jgi:hypothetical protein
MTDSHSTLDDKADDEPIGDTRETCFFWESRAGACRFESLIPGSEPCADCPDGGDWSDRADAVRSRPESQPSYMDNPKAVGAPAGWPWGYLPCGCRNDGFGNHAGHKR